MVLLLGTDLPQCAEPPDPIVKGENCNRKPIQKVTSVYQMQLCTVSSALIIVRIPFAPIKGCRYIDPMDYLLCNKCEVHLSDENTNKANGPTFIWPYFYWIILSCEDIHNHYSYEFIWKIVP